MSWLLLDTANIVDIATFIRTRAIAGVTTNPSLMAKEKKSDYIEHLVKVCETITEGSLGDERKHLSVEVTTLVPEEMKHQALSLYQRLSVFKNIDLHVKIPATLGTLYVISQLAHQGVKVNATACITASQAKIASDAGAAIVSFFYNRGKDAVVDVDAEVTKFQGTFPDSRVICGSIRDPKDVWKCWGAGADFVTVPVTVLEKMMDHSQTREAMKRFQEDIDRWLA